MSALLTILGGGGWFPAHERHTACALLRDGEHGILIDAGTGACRLVERPELLNGIVRLDIVLTHFHLDHIAGLAYLPAIGLCEQTTLWGPGKLLYETATSELIGRVSHEPFHPVSLDAQQIEVRDLPADEIELGSVRLSLRQQGRHSAPTLGLRFDDRLAWVTDTAFDPDSARFAEGCRTLAHEAWFPSAEPRNPEIHSSAAEAARVAAGAGAERLLLTHLPPFAPDLAELLQDAAGAGHPDATLAVDGLRVSPAA